MVPEVAAATFGTMVGKFGDMLGPMWQGFKVGFCEGSVIDFANTWRFSRLLTGTTQGLLTQTDIQGHVRIVLVHI